jgi:hypothetical protein
VLEKKEHKFQKNNEVAFAHHPEWCRVVWFPKYLKEQFVLDEEISSYEEAMFFNGGIDCHG